ncbi:MAG: hypothetical protein C6I00_04400 [Nitratiruptor sp.]|nr:hypothetical protein [Nitratiruptor sp.]NPA84027.1 hypothetical protein [Campylobacterota bacterium]
MHFFRRISPLILLLADGATIALAIVAAYESRELFIGPNDIPLQRYLAFFPFYIPLLLFLSNGLYRYRYDFWHESRLVVQSLLFALLILLSFLAITRTIESYSRYVLLASFFFMALFIPVQKRLLKWLLYRIGLWRRKVKLLGADLRMAQTLGANFYLGYTPVEQGYETLLIDPATLGPGRIEEVLKAEILRHHELLFIPIIRDFNLADSTIFEIIDTRLNLILLQNRLASRFNMALKEGTDKLLASILLLFFAPLLGIIALAVYLEDPSSPILYRQKRIGQGGREFLFYKFRTMDPSIDLQSYLLASPHLAQEYRRYKKLRNDPRITRLGALLRRYSLDELPQLLNVLRGDMSLVGPRPYMPEELEEMGEYAQIILSVKPGLTGLWQVSGRNNLTFQERLHIDLWYVYNWSLWKDLVILLKTLRAILSKEGAY